MSSTMFLISLVCFIVSLISIGIWTNNDSKRKNLNNRLWTAITVLIPFCIGFAIYFIANPKKSIFECPYCKYIGKKNTNTCPSCGARLTDVNASPSPDPSNKKYLVTYIISVVGVVIFFIAGMISFVVSLFSSL